MSSEAFAQRVRHLRTAWSERRESMELSRTHDFESQFRLLLALHGWATDASREVAGVYGAALPVSVSPSPTPDPLAAGFTVSVGEWYTLAFRLSERQGPSGSRWAVTAALGPEGSAVEAGPERRNGHWTRGRLEDLLLSVLAAWERAQSDRDAESSSGRLRTRGA